jgi:hypothetical protein
MRPVVGLIVLVGAHAAVAAPSTAAIVGLAAGYGHTCALHVDGSVSCWGDNENGQLGDGTTRSSATPVRVLGLDDASEITAHALRTCARRRNDSVVCWGAEQRANAPVPKPIRIDVYDDVLQVAGPCFRTMTSAACLDVHNTPQPLSGAGDIIDIAAREYYSGCVVHRSGTVGCWFNPMVVRDIPGIRDAVEVAQVSTVACARTKAGVVVCWSWGHDVVQSGGASKVVELAPKVARVTTPPAERFVYGDREICWLSRRDVWCIGEDRRGAVLRPPLRAATLLAFDHEHGCVARGPRDVACWAQDGQVERLRWGSAQQ